MFLDCQAVIEVRRFPHPCLTGTLNADKLLKVLLLRGSYLIAQPCRCILPLV